MTQETTVLDELKFLETNRNFLGREFLTWLWFKSESQNHKIRTKNFGDFQCQIRLPNLYKMKRGQHRDTPFPQMLRLRQFKQNAEIFIC